MSLKKDLGAIYRWIVLMLYCQKLCFQKKGLHQICITEINMTPVLINLEGNNSRLTLL